MVPQVRGATTLMLTEKERGHRGLYNPHCQVASIPMPEAAEFRGKIVIYGHAPDLQTQRPGSENRFLGTWKLHRAPI